MAALRPRLVVAFDTSGVSGARLARSLARPRLHTFARVELPAGALAASAVGPNILRPDAMEEALTALRARLGDHAAATLVLPDGVARIVLLEVPSGTERRAYARFRLAPTLPFPVEEALFDVLDLGRGRALGAALHRGVVGEYEQAAARAGFVQERVDLAPLVALAGVRNRGAGVHVVLGDAALSLTAFRDSRVAAFRTRRRDPEPGEAERLFAEAARTALLAGGGDGDGLDLTFVGPGAHGLVQELVGSGRSARVAGATGEPPAAESAWLAGVLA